MKAGAIALVCVGIVAAVLGGYIWFRTTQPFGPSNYFDPGRGYTNGGTCGDRSAQCDFARAVLGSLEDEWRPLVEGDRVRAGGGGDTTFDTPTMVVFGGGVATPCGAYATERGPFYCPDDGNFYLDFVWLDDLWSNAPGDMGQAIIIAHEYAHWVQTKMGIGESVRRFTRQHSVRYELQADCLAGVWASLAREDLRIDDSDLVEAMSVASYIGNDVTQARNGASIRPSTFTHGSSQQRMRWVRRGFESGGDPTVCATFDIPFEEL